MTEKKLESRLQPLPMLDDYLDGRTSPAECSAFRASIFPHVRHCRDTGRIRPEFWGMRLNRISRLAMPDDSDLRIRIALWAESAPIPLRDRRDGYR